MLRDKFTLNRFILAQNDGDSYANALAEIKNGRKTSCWMWYVCPQLLGLGFSEMCLKYAIRTPQEASEYLTNEILRERLEAILEASLACFTKGLSPLKVFGAPDDQKLQSCVTLFGAVANFYDYPRIRSLCNDILSTAYNGQRCQSTLAILHYLSQLDEMKGLSKRQKVSK